MESVDPNLAHPYKLREEPIREKLRRLKEEPNVT
jgi:hypothetical protein